MFAPGRKRNIYLTGMMGTGKSAVGELLACKLHYVFIDTDAVIERQESATVSEIFRDRGEEYFREQERVLLPEIISREHQVIATGGGMLADPGNLGVAALNGLVILLRAPIEVLVPRLRDDSQRPLLDNDDLQSRLKEIWRQRESVYESIKHQIDTSHGDIHRVAENIIDLYQGWLES
jgi:shikimate kinase